MNLGRENKRKDISKREKGEAEKLGKVGWGRGGGGGPATTNHHHHHHVIAVSKVKTIAGLPSKNM